jgi:uncharacterized protein Veg
MKQIIEHLEAMKGQYIALSLYPGIHRTIKAEGNILKINEGRSGTFEGVSESFYDKLVDTYDSRSKNRIK